MEITSTNFDFYFDNDLISSEDINLYQFNYDNYDMFDIGIK